MDDIQLKLNDAMHWAFVLFPFVHKQFQRHPEKYADIWKKAPVK